MAEAHFLCTTCCVCDVPSLRPIDGAVDSICTTSHDNEGSTWGRLCMYSQPVKQP